MLNRETTSPDDRLAAEDGRVGRDALEQRMALARTAALLRGTDALVPRGVYRFDSFDEADTIDSARRGDLSYCFS
jgi:hypothetical protein